MNEEALVFGAAHAMTGIVSRPSGDARRTGVVLMNAGVTHRVGPNRLYVRIARRLAEAGYPVFRFDFSGLGDSDVRRDRLPPEQSVFLETQEALDAFASHAGVDQFILMGVCSGATIAYITAQDDPRVTGAVMINAIGHLHGKNPVLAAHYRGRATARHSWRIALFSSFRRKNWSKLLTGRLSPRQIFRMMVAAPVSVLMGRKQSPHPAPPTAPVDRVALADHDPLAGLQELSDRGVTLFHLYCEGDEGLDYYHVVLGKRNKAAAAVQGHRFEVIRGANHVFTMRWSQDQLLQSISGWIKEFETRQRAIA